MQPTSMIRLMLCAVIAIAISLPIGSTWGQTSGQTRNPAPGEERGNAEETEKSSKTVRDLILWKILTTSEMHSQLTQIALEKVENEELKSYAQMLAVDHAELQQQVERAMRGPQRQPQLANSEIAVSEKPRVPVELCQILERANDNTLMMLQEMLRAHEGQDFQMAFLGQQAVAQTILLAELNAMQSSTKFQDIKPIVQQAIAQTMRHLDRAKQLASQFEKDVKVERSTDRPAGATNVQPGNGQPENGQPENQ